jgi:TonB family protein
MVRCLRIENSATDGAPGDSAVYGLADDHAPATRGCGLALTVLLHLAIVALLCLRLPAATVEEARVATPSVVLLTLPSAVPQPAIAPSPAAKSKPRTRKPSEPPVAHAAAKRQVESVRDEPAQAEPHVTADTSTSLGASAAPQLAAGPPPAALADTPPPLEYLRRIARIIGLSQHYPWSARQYGHEGDVLVRMHLSRDGTVLAVTLIRSSGHASLDAEARDVVWRIGRFPPFPFDYLPRIGEFDIDQPISFRHYLN